MDLFSSLPQQPLVLSLDVACVAEMDWSELVAILSSSERARANAFIHDADRRSFIAGHALLRLSLAALLDDDAQALDFAQNDYGKPELAGRHAATGLRFNLSHSRRMVVVGFAQAVAIGVDTEMSERLAEADLMAVARTFAPDEQAYLDQAVGTERALRFIKLWTLKEAVIKAAGAGLSIPLDSFSVDVDRYALSGLGGAWSLRAWSVKDDQIAVALTGASLSPRHVGVVITKTATRLKVVEVLKRVLE